MSVRIIEGDALTVLRTLPDQSVQCCVTSPPYFGLRDYGVSGQLGLEKTPQLYVDAMVGVFSEVKRVLRDDGTLWLNIGDSYNGSGARSDNPSGPTPKQATNRGSLIRGKRVERGPGSGRWGGGNVVVPSCKPKDLIGIPWMLAFALRADGWYLRSDIIWHKPNPMPESVTDRPTKSHEYLFLFAKSPRYYYDADAIAEPGSLNVPWGANSNGGQKAAVSRNDGNSAGLGKPARKTDKQRGHGRRHAGFNDRWDAMERTEQCSGMRNRRSVWTIPTSPYTEAHFATFPPKLIEPCILAGSAKGDTVLDPFGGAGTTGLVADRLGRDAILIELNPKYAEMARRRITDDAPLFADGAA